jgi:hypothetical protein
MKHIQNFLILLVFILLSSCENNNPTVAFENNCDCYKGDDLAELPDINPLPTGSLRLWWSTSFACLFAFYR